MVDLSGLCVELYSASTPNGIKVAACLEELRSLSNGKFQYEQVTIDIRNNAQVAEEYLQINPNGKVPTIVNAEEGCIVYESGAILLYLAEKSGALLPSDRAVRTIATSWLFWSSTGLSNQVKQFGYYYKSCQHSIPYCVSRYAKEVKRLLLVLEKHLSDNRAYIIGGILHSNITFLLIMRTHFYLVKICESAQRSTLLLTLASGLGSMLYTTTADRRLR